MSLTAGLVSVNAKRLSACLLHRGYHALSRVVYGDFVVRLATPVDIDQIVGPVSAGVYGSLDYYPARAAEQIASAPLPSIQSWF